MVIGTVAGQEALHMPLMQDDHLIQTCPPDTANEPFHLRITSTMSTHNVPVGTTKQSMATRSCTGFFRKVFHVGASGCLGHDRYFSTVDVATSAPSFRSAPTIRSAPHVGLACHIWSCLSSLRLMRLALSGAVRMTSAGGA